MVILDLDLKNAFPNFEWDHIRAGVDNHAPDVAGWTRWCHSDESFVILPCGRILWSNRGAEQGDPLGSLYCGVVLIDVIKRTRERIQAELHDDSDVFFDVWYMDDGQVILDPRHVHLFLQVFDEELLKVGATRGRVEPGGDMEELKSVAKLIGSAEGILEVDDDWATPYVRSTCRIAPNNGNGHVLGIDFGDTGVATVQFEECIDKIELLHRSISSLGSAGSELVLLRRCADICKLTHLLRAAGHIIAPVSLRRFDEHLDRTLSLIVGGSLHNEAILQASLGV